MLETLALNEPDIPQVQDDLDNWQILKDNEYLNKFKDLAGIGAKNKEPKKVLSKVNLNNNSQITKDDVKQAVISGEIHKKLVKEIKDMCKVVNLSSDGKKQELIERIRAKFMD